MSYKKVVPACVVCLFLYLLPQNIFSDDIKKANRYYEKYDYKYAIEIYEKIMQRKPSLEVAQKLANCYRFINNTEAAERAYARVLTFSGFDPVNYRYYADALKQNGKFEQAKQNYLLYADQAASKADQARVLANSADVARMWHENPDPSVRIDNELGFNTEYAEFSPVPFDDGYVFVSDRWFTQKRGNEKEVYGWTGNPFLKLYTASPANARAPRIALFPEPVNNDFHNGPAVFSAGSDTVYFTRVGLNQKKKKRDDPVINKKSIYFSVRTDSKWSEPQRIPFNTPENFSVQHPALSPDGSILYFASDMPGGSGGMDIYASRKQADGTWGTPVNCGTHINSPEDDVFPSVRKDGRFYFASKGHVGMGGLDIFTASGAYNEFTIAENLRSPLNSSRDDFGIMYFDDQSGYLSSNRKGGRGLDDIYRFSVTPPVKKEEEKPDAKSVFFAVEGQVVERRTGTPMPGIVIYLINKGTGEEKTTTSNEQGRFRFDLEANTDYVVRGDIEKYFSRQEGQISTKGVTESTLFSVKFELEQSQDAYLVRLNNIYYNFDKWNIRADAVPELNKVVNFMNSMPNLNIELRSHTDARGPAIYNLWLSQKRAQSAVNYLKDQGVPEKRLTAVGLGETELINRCRDGVQCTAREHQMNRRTEFKVVKVNPVLSLVSAPMANVR